MGKGVARDGHDQHGNPDKAKDSKKYECQNCDKDGLDSKGKVCGICNGTKEID